MGKGGSGNGDAEARLFHDDIGPLAGLIGLLHALLRGDQLAAVLAESQRLHGLDQHVALVVEAVLQHDVIVADRHHLPPPHHRRRLLGRGFHHVDLVAVVRLDAQQPVRVVLDEIVGLGQVIIGKVRTHPALAHHRRRNLDDAVDARGKTPHVLVEQQRGITGVLGRRRHAHQRFLLPARPDTDGHGARPVRTADGHVDHGVRGNVTPVVDGAFDDGGRVRFGCKRSVWHR